MNLREAIITAGKYGLIPALMELVNHYDYTPEEALSKLDIL